MVWIGIPMPQLFLSYARPDEFEAQLFQRVLEAELPGTKVWAFQRDQQLSTRDLSRFIQRAIQDSLGVIFLISQFTLKDGGNQWYELGIADAFEKRTFFLLHHVTLHDVKQVERGIPPLLFNADCILATEWIRLIPDLQTILFNSNRVE